MADNPGIQKMISASALHQPLFWLAVITLFFVVFVVAELCLGSRKVKWLHTIAPMTGPDLPKISLIVAGRNEERNVEKAMRSLLAQDYPNLELIAVDDRSNDNTGAILDRIAAQEPRLKVIHVRELPPGWLGKCHALHAGSEHALGEWLLFADADIVMDPTTLGRAIAYALENKIDHLAVAPRIEMKGFLTNCFAAFFGMTFTAYFKPWKVSDPKSDKYMGIGAFNMVLTEVYRKIGGHRPIAMRPDDDMMFGKLIKKNGYRQDILFGGKLMSVEWYSSFSEMVGGLMKNSFSGTDYRVSVVIVGTVVHLVCSFWPFAALLLTGGVVWWINLAIVLILLGGSMDCARFFGLPAWRGFFYPLGCALFLYIVWRATWITLANDGIDWRGTHYSLKELKANRV
jgi:glycosyltransferase involved in cell wall biosynthesis